VAEKQATSATPQLTNAAIHSVAARVSHTAQQEVKMVLIWDMVAFLVNSRNNIQISKKKKKKI
jgi:hypothetical protein